MTDGIPEKPITVEQLTALYAEAETCRAKVNQLKAELGGAEDTLRAATHAIGKHFAYVEVDSKEFHIFNCKSDVDAVNEAIAKLGMRQSLFCRPPEFRAGTGYLDWRDIPPAGLIKKHRQIKPALKHLAKHLEREQARRVSQGRVSLILYGDNSSPNKVT